MLTAHDNTELTAIDVGNGPRDVAFDGTNIWVTNLDDDTVSKIIPT